MRRARAQQPNVTVQQPAAFLDRPRSDEEAQDYLDRDYNISSGAAHVARLLRERRRPDVQSVWEKPRYLTANLDAWARQRLGAARRSNAEKQARRHIASTAA